MLIEMAAGNSPSQRAQREEGVIWGKALNTEAMIEQRSPCLEYSRENQSGSNGAGANSNAAIMHNLF